LETVAPSQTTSSLSSFCHGGDVTLRERENLKTLSMNELAAWGDESIYLKRN
jgi:hypothetical protein